MHILYLSQYFPPEAGATQTRAYEMARTWVRLGHQVTVLTEFPNHPSGIIPPDYRGKYIEIKDLDGINVIRVWVKASPKKNFHNRMLFYLTYMLNASLAGLLAAHGKFNFIYATSPPLFVGAAALFLSYTRRIPLIFEVRDLWPESAVALGELASPKAITLATRLEEQCYNKSTQVVVVTHGIYDRLLQRGIAKSKLCFVPNGANTDLFTYSASGRQRIRSELNLEGRFVAIYAGIHGLAQGLETILEAARLLQSQEDIHILMIGDGPKKAELLELAGRYNLPNLTMLPEKPREQIPDYLSAADVALIPLKKVEIFKGALPSKIFDAWSCSRPVLLSINGEARQIVESVQGGIFVPLEDPDKMAEALLHMKAIPAERQRMGENGLNYTRANHSRTALAEKLIRHLEELI
ncbi:MAG: glycosyltransferase WbuB [Anaerolineales bacterium]|nr:MAG: glycosyltransferase WbuB [Anaerolineales bacterium]